MAGHAGGGDVELLGLRLANEDHLPEEAEAAFEKAR